MRPLPRSFYLRPTIEVAKELPGKILVRKLRGRRFAGRIVEVEAYLGDSDPASHAYRGRTKRNAVMFGEGGHLYVYFTYGMHYCCNVVTEGEGHGCAVLLRAVEPLEGIHQMACRRGLARTAPDAPPDPNLTNGPAKLCEAFGISKRDNGMDLCDTTISIATDGLPVPPLAATSRVGITAGKEHRWRFFVKGNRFVSKGKPSTE